MYKSWNIQIFYISPFTGSVKKQKIHCDLVTIYWNQVYSFDTVVLEIYFTDTVQTEFTQIKEASLKV
jgi:hypothetical protein